jgi:copper chaperone
MAPKTYTVEGMTCDGCVKTLTRALERALPSVKIDVTLEGGKVNVDGEHTEEAVRQAVEDAGYDFVGGAV